MKRKANGHLVYRQEDIHTLRPISCLIKTGMPLEEMRKTKPVSPVQMNYFPVSVKAAMSPTTKKAHDNEFLEKMGGNMMIRNDCFPHFFALDYSYMRFFEFAATTNNRTIRTSVMNSIVPPKLKLVK